MKKSRSYLLTLLTAACVAALTCGLLAGCGESTSKVDSASSSPSASSSSASASPASSASSSSSKASSASPSASSASSSSAANSTSGGATKSASYGISDDWETVTGYEWVSYVPEDWKGLISADVSNDGQTMRIYLASLDAQGYGGTLVTVIYSDDAQPPYPSYDRVHSFDNGCYLYAVYPTDVQYDPDDSSLYLSCSDSLDSFLKMMEF